jgi:thiamine biosynthesis protein ThiS
MEIVVNGEPAIVPEHSTVAALLVRIGLDPARVAVELDRRIVRKTEWESTVLAPGAQVEIVQFVGGG